MLNDELLIENNDRSFLEKIIEIIYLKCEYELINKDKVKEYIKKKVLNEKNYIKKIDMIDVFFKKIVDNIDSKFRSKIKTIRNKMHNCITNNDKIDLDNCKIMYILYTMMNIKKKYLNIVTI